MFYKQLSIKQYLCQSIALLISSLLFLNAISCNCANSSKQIQTEKEPKKGGEESKEGEELTLGVSPIRLVGDSKTTEAMFTATDSKKMVDLTQFKVRITCTGAAGNDSSVTYRDGAKSTRSIKTSLEESVVHFFGIKQLEASGGPLKLPFTIDTGKNETSITIKFELLDKKDKVLKEYIVDWKERESADSPVLLKITTLTYDQANYTVTYKVENLGKREVKDVKLHYKNISIDDAGKTALLDSKTEQIIHLPNIAAGGSTKEESLKLNFQSSSQANFRFALFCQGTMLESATREEEFSKKAPQLKLITVGPSYLVGEEGKNKGFGFKIEQKALGTPVEVNKVKLMVNKPSYYTDVKIFLHGKEITEILATQLGPIGQTLYLTIQADKYPSADFTLQLQYADKDVGKPETFTWLSSVQRGAYDAICQAIWRKNVSKMKQLLKLDGVKVDGIDDMGNTLLHHAAKLGNKEAIKELLDAGADANIKNKDGYIPLYLAVEEGNQDAVNELLANRPNANAIDNNGDTALHRAVEAKNIAVISVLLSSSKINANATDNNGDTALHRAVEGKNIAVISVLLNSNKINANATDNNGDTALHRAIERKDNALISALLNSSKINLNAINKFGKCPLHLAVNISNVELIDKLIKENADINTRDKNGNTCLHLAVLTDNEKVVKELIVKGANVNVINNDGHMPLQLAKSKKIIMLLLGVELMDLDDVINKETGFTLLHKAAVEDGLIAIQKLISNGANINVIDNNGNTPLHKAVEKGNEAAVELLIRKKANIETKNSKGNTALHQAIEKKNKAVISLLLERGADVNCRDGLRQTPLYLAIQDNDQELITKLIEKGVNVNAQNNYVGFTPLHEAILKNNQEAIKKLLNVKNIQVNIRDFAGCTPLLLAATENNAETIKLLIEKGANIYATTKEYYALLQVATTKEAIIALLKKNNLNARYNNQLLLHKAIKDKKQVMVEGLIESGADVNIKDDTSFNYSPLHTAVIEHNQEAIKTLLNSDKIILDTLDDHGNTPLHLAVEEDDEVIVELLLLDKRVKGHVENKDGKTAYNLAQESTNGAIRRLFGIALP